MLAMIVFQKVAANMTQAEYDWYNRWSLFGIFCIIWFVGYVCFWRKP